MASSCRRTHRFAGLIFKLPAGLAGNAATGLGRGCVVGHAGGIRRFGNLPGGELGQRGEDEFGLGLAVAQVVAGQLLRPLVVLDAQTGPFLTNLK